MDITAYNDLPWLKDNDNLWEEWDVSNRDLFFINKEGKFSYKINLSNSYPENEIKNIIENISNCY